MSNFQYKFLKLHHYKREKKNKINNKYIYKSTLSKKMK